jgi:hypothetical protein
LKRYGEAGGVALIVFVVASSAIDRIMHLVGLESQQVVVAAEDLAISKTVLHSDDSTVR